MIAEVIINTTAKKLNRTFDYRIPPLLEGLVHIGTKVLVPFGNSKKLEEAHVVKIKEMSEFDLKDIAKIDGELTNEQIELAKWMSKKYFCNISDCIKLMQTPGTRTKNLENRIQNKKINVISFNNYLKDNFEKTLNEIKTEKQKKVLLFIRDNPKSTIQEISMFTNCSAGVIQTLIKKGYLKKEVQIIERNPLIFKEDSRKPKLELTSEQRVVFETISESLIRSQFKEYLLYGITGSGKTEVYLQLIEKTIKLNKKAILLVPEISLTPQMIERFISRFGKQDIAVLHSKLSIGERHDEWQRIRDNKAKIVIGARSAIFAPINNLGIIIIDEEHDSSYKSETTPKYDAKEIANKIAQNEKIPVVLGSATPDLKTYYNSINGNIELLKLTKRANNSNLPEVEIIDLKQELANGNRSMLSIRLYEEIEKNLKEKNQTILFLNRRGYSTFIMCRECGYTVKCKNCNISMTYHSFQNKLKCHYCGYEKSLVTKCPECGSDKIRYFGTGTQKLQNIILKEFPQATTIRMDVDTVTKKNSHEKILNKFKNEKIDILIGTQMVVKGHHFPKVTLVGVIAADSSLNIDDYRATERTFQILTQVAGRAGRDKLPGKVIVQTYNPQEYSIQYAKDQDYKKFYETEIAIRKQLKYPPFCDIIVVSFTSTFENEIKKISSWVYKQLKILLEKEDFKIFKPMPSPIDKINNNYRWRIVLKGEMTKSANEKLNNMLKNIYDKDFKKVKISIDVNSNNMI